MRLLFFQHQTTFRSPSKVVCWLFRTSVTSSHYFPAVKFNKINKEFFLPCSLFQVVKALWLAFTAMHSEAFNTKSIKQYRKKYNN